MLNILLPQSILEVVEQSQGGCLAHGKLFFFKYVVQRYRIFFSPEKFIFYTFLGKTDWMNEKAVFFFPRPEKKNSSEIEWMNEHVNFSRKKKKQKKCQNFRKKKNNPFC